MCKINYFIILCLLIGCTNQKQSTPASKPNIAQSATLDSSVVVEQASIEDTYKKKGTGSAYAFFVSKVDGIPTTHNASTESRKVSAGNGIYLFPVGASRNIPIKPLKMSLTAKVIYAAPIVAITDSETDLILEQDIEFTPQPDMFYYVKGVLSKSNSSIWIEDINGEKVSRHLSKANPSIQNSTPTTASLFSQISTGESLNSVIKKLGKPDNISEYKASIFTGPPAHSFTTYEYNNLGSIKFFGVHPNIRSVEQVMSGADVGTTPETLREKINSAPAAELRLLAKDYFLAKTPNIEFLDVFAEKIWLERMTKDRNMQDAVAYLCLALGKSKNARYRDFFMSVINTSSSAKIKKYAEQNLALISTESENQFQPLNN